MSYCYNNKNHNIGVKLNVHPIDTYWVQLDQICASCIGSKQQMEPAPSTSSPPNTDYWHSGAKGG